MKPSNPNKSGLVRLLSVQQKQQAPDLPIKKALGAWFYCLLTACLGSSDDRLLKAFKSSAEDGRFRAKLMNHLEFTVSVFCPRTAPPRDPNKLNDQAIGAL